MLPTSEKHIWVSSGWQTQACHCGFRRWETALERQGLQDSRLLTKTQGRNSEKKQNRGGQAAWWVGALRAPLCALVGCRHAPVFLLATEWSRGSLAAAFRALS